MRRGGAQPRDVEDGGGARERRERHHRRSRRRTAIASVTIGDVRNIDPGGVEAVKGVSLTMPDGAFTVLLGPSGCGKSTLLRMIAGLEAIAAGSVSIAGKRVNEVEPADRDIAMVFQ